MPSKKQEERAQAALQEMRSQMSQQLVPDKPTTEGQEVVKRKTALDFKSTQKLKELILRDVARNNSPSVTQYTKSLVKQYLQNPYSYRTQLIGVSRFLWRMSTLYKKIVMYYAMMPLYNYNVVEKVDFTKKINTNKLLKDYENVLKRLHKFNFKNEFATAIALAIRDGVYCGYIYDFEMDGSFLHMLPVEYFKIRGKNEAGQWVVAFDATYFAQGQNLIFVEGIDGDTSGCWDQPFIDGWKAYQADRNARWFLLPADRTLTLLASLDDEFENPLPFFSGLFMPVLDNLDFAQIIADKTFLENFYLLLLQIPTFDDNDVVDDFKVSLEIAEAYKNAISEIMPSLAGAGLLPGMTADLITFNKANASNDESILAENTNQVFAQAGANQLVVSSGGSTSNLAIKLSVANDLSYTSLLLSRLESNFQYYIEKNISENVIFDIHRQTYYNDEEYLQKMKDASVLGSSAIRYLTAQGMTPYQAYCYIQFESAIGIKSMMEPLESSYNRTSDGQEKSPGRSRVNDGDLSGSAERTRNTGSTIAE